MAVRRQSAASLPVAAAALAAASLMAGLASSSSTTLDTWKSTAETGMSSGRRGPARSPADALPASHTVVTIYVSALKGLMRGARGLCDTWELKLLL